LRRRSRSEAAIAGEMLEQTALHFVGESVIGTEAANNAGNFAFGGALPRALDGVEDAAQQARPSRGGFAAGTMLQFADPAEIPVKRNANHGWILSIPLRYSHSFNALRGNLMLVMLGNNGYVLIR
jgi:hypothetical protein